MSIELPTSATATLPLEDVHRPATSRIRWWILVLAFFGTTINYVDRQVWNVLGPFLGGEFKISDSQWGLIGSSFGLSYAIGQLMAGGILDRVGVRLGYPIGLALWSFVAMAHAWAIGVGGAVGSILGLTAGAGFIGFFVLRGLLGLTESPNFPAVTKALSEWFPKKERAYAMGWVNAGCNVGMLVAMLMVEPITARYGWQWAFIITGGLGFVWLLFWIPIYRRPEHHPRVSAAELAIINSDPPEPTTKIPWRTLFTYRQTWAFALSKFITDAMWLSYMIWFAKFFKEKFDLDLKNVGLPLIAVYVLADIGSVAGGWASSTLIKRGSSVNRARKQVLLASAICVMPIMFGTLPGNQWIAVILLGLATAGHQSFSSNQYTLVSDMFPKRAVASVAGLGGTFGYLGAAIWSGASGYIKEATGSYLILFIVPAVGYLVAFAIIQLFAPRLEPALVDEPTPGDGQPRGFDVLPPR